MNAHAEALKRSLDTVPAENREHVELIIAALDKFDGKIVLVENKK